MSAHAHGQQQTIIWVQTHGTHTALTQGLLLLSRLVSSHVPSRTSIFIPPLLSLRSEMRSRLRSFAALGVPRHGWDEVGPDHPVLAVEGGRLRVRRQWRSTCRGRRTDLGTQT